MKVAITGSSGLIGTALRASLEADGHEVVRLVRRPPRQRGEVRWDPAAGEIDLSDLEDVGTVFNLSGANVGAHYWTTAYRRTLLDSRVDATRTIAGALAALQQRRPRVLVSMSGIGIYGPQHGAEILREDSPAGAGFVSQMCQAWEAATRPASDAGVRVALARTSPVMTARGGALRRMLPVFRLGLGGRLGSGRQYWSFVSLDDAVRALRHLAEQPECAGPHNVTAPQPVTNAEFTRVLAAQVHRPAVLPVPAIALRAVIGGFAQEVLASFRVTPDRLLRQRFAFLHPDAASVLRAALR